MAAPKNTTNWPPLDNALRELWASGVSSMLIAKKLGVTKNAMLGRAHRLGLPSRPSPIKRNGEPLLDKHSPASRRCTLKNIIDAPSGESQIELILPTVRPGRVQPCCYPLGNPGSVAFRFCEAASVPGKPYCLTHCKLVYVSYGAKPALEGDVG